jgi:hypothetical protein
LLERQRLVTMNDAQPRDAVEVSGWGGASMLLNPLSH